jgi:hypothetical protein
MRGGERAGVFLRLPLGVQHQHVPGAVGTALAAILRFVLRAEQIVLAGDFLGLAFPAALLGLKDERVAFVEIDAALRVAIAQMPLDRALEHIIVVRVGRLATSGWGSPSTSQSSVRNSA